MASPAPHRPTPPSGTPPAGSGAPSSIAKGSGPSIPPPPKSGPPPVSPSPAGGGASGTAIQISTTPQNPAPQRSSPPQQPSNRRAWLGRVAAILFPLAAGGAYYLYRRGEKETPDQTPTSPSASGIKSNAVQLHIHPVQASPLTKDQYNDISQWKSTAPVAPRPGQLFGNVHNDKNAPDTWLETASKLNSLLVLKIRSQIEELNTLSSKNSSQESDKVKALRPKHPLAFNIADTSTWVGSDGYSPISFVREVTTELNDRTNADYKNPDPNGTRYLRSALRMDWPQRWPEYLIARLDSLVELHKALLAEQTSK